MKGDWTISLVSIDLLNGNIDSFAVFACLEIEVVTELNLNVYSVNHAVSSSKDVLIRNQGPTTLISSSDSVLFLNWVESDHLRPMESWISSDYFYVRLKLSATYPAVLIVIYKQRNMDWSLNLLTSSPCFYSRIDGLYRLMSGLVECLKVGICYRYAKFGSKAVIGSAVKHLNI